jgi:hypothetical protein
VILLHSLVTIICPRSWDVSERLVAWVRLHGHEIRLKNPEKGGKKRKQEKVEMQIGKGKKTNEEK